MRKKYIVPAERIKVVSFECFCGVGDSGQHGNPIGWNGDKGSGGYAGGADDNDLDNGGGAAKGYSTWDVEW